MKLLENFSFIDSDGKMWTAPKGEIVDGSSIPRWAWSIIGSPFVGEHRNASVIHDVFCRFRIETDNATHEMYIEAIKVSGVGKFKSKLMKTALKIGAPKW